MKKYFPALAISGLVVIIVVFLVYLSDTTSTTSITQNLADNAVVARVANINQDVIDGVGTDGLANPLHATKENPSNILTDNGKPEILYIGAGYCPYCAAERWSMIAALGRFGTFTHLSYGASSSTDSFPNTPTFSFYKSAYTSKYISFVAVEETAQDQSVTLQNPSSAQQALFQKYDYQPYISQAQEGGIPFVDFGNQYIVSGSGYSPQILANLSQKQIANNLPNRANTVTQSIVGNANYLNAAICKLTHDQPATACTDTIKKIEADL